MKNKINIKSLVFGALLGAFVVFTMGAATDRSDESSQAKAWEYKELNGHDGTVNKLGEQGWSLVGYSVDDGTHWYVMRRPMK